MDFLSDARKDSYNIRTYMVEYYAKEIERQREKEEYEKQERERFKKAVQELKSKIHYSSQKLEFIKNLESEISNIVTGMEKLSGIDLLEKFLLFQQNLQSRERSVTDMLNSLVINVPERFEADLLEKEDKLYLEVVNFNKSVEIAKVGLASFLQTVNEAVAIKENEFQIVLEERKTVEKQIEVLKQKVNGISSFVSQVFDDYFARRNDVISDLDAALSAVTEKIKCLNSRELFKAKLDSMYRKLDTITFENFSDEDYSQIDTDIEQLQNEIEKLVDQLYGEFNDDLSATNAVVQSVNQLLNNRDLIGQDDKIIGSLKSENMVLR